MIARFDVVNVSRSAVCSSNVSFVAATEQVVLLPFGILAGTHDWLRLTLPGVWIQATGMCIGCAPLFRLIRICPNCCTPCGASVRIVIVRVLLAPGASENDDGVTWMDEFARVLVVTMKLRVKPVTFLTTLVVVSRPGSTGALIDGTFRSTAWIGSPVSAA